MNVCVDGRWDADTGIGRLYREVVNRAPSSVKMDILNFSVNPGDPLDPIYLSNIVKKSKCDIFYSPGFMPPLNCSVPYIITIHDLNHLYFYSLFHKLYLKHVIGRLALKSKKIITVSKFTKSEIVKKLIINPNDIEVVYNGVDNSFSSNKEKFSVGRPYFFYIGNKRTHKNIERMLCAFAAANIPRDFLFVLSGNTNDKLEKEIKSLNIEDRVIFLGDIANEDLPKVYKGAFLLIFVSLMEGFGLPIIEAMASGIPVITSNITSMPEISGDAALLVNPYSIKEISSAIEHLVEDADLRLNLINKGYERVKLFNWNETTQKTWDLIL